MFRIYGKDLCIACKEAKNFLDSKGIKYEYLTLGKDYQMSEFIEASQGNVHRTMPLVVHAGDVDCVWVYLGGLDALKKHLS